MISVGKRNEYKAFYNYLLLVREVRDSTATFYVQKVGVLLRLSPVLSATSLTQTFLELKEKGVKNSYINKLREIARIYCDFLKHSGVEVDKSIYSIKKLKEEAVMRATMSDSEIEAFLNLPPKRNGPKETANYNRWTLFFSIMSFCGLRPQQVARLEVDHCDLGRGVFIITEENSKTHHPCLIPIPPNIFKDIEQHIKTCDKYLFPARKKSVRFDLPIVDNVDWGYNFHERISRLGIKRKGLVPYSLRHSFCTRLLESGVDLFHVKKLMQHKRLETTEIYSHLTTQDIQQAITKHPLIRKATDPQQILDAFKEVIRSFEFEKNEKFTFSMLDSGKGLKLYLSFK